jgi:glycosyltransferase involved in cell wall biosynthesis
MKAWVIHAQEPLALPTTVTPRRLWRSNTIAEILGGRGHSVIRWRSSYSHYEKRYLVRGSQMAAGEGYNYQFLEGPAYKRNIGFKRVRHHRAIAADFAKLANGQTPVPDIIHVSNVPLELCREAVRFSVKKGIPVIIDVRDLWPDLFLDLVPQTLSFLKPAVRLMLRSSYEDAVYAMRHATAITGLTEPFVDWGVRLAGRKRREFDRVFHMSYPENGGRGLDAGLTKLSAKIGLKNEEFVYCYFGSIGYQSDFDTLLRAARLIEGRISAKFVICGEGPRLGGLRKKASMLTNVVFPGWLDAEEIQCLMRISTVGFLPFKERDNYLLNMPNKFSEYLSGGMVIACGLEGEMARLVRAHDCGFVYPSGDAFKLAEKLVELTASLDRVAAMKVNARALFKQSFNCQVVYGKLCDYLETMVALNRVS